MLKTQSKTLYKKYYNQLQLINNQLKQIQWITKSKITDCTRMTIGSDRKQFFSSDPTKNKNEFDSIWRKKLKIASDPIHFYSIRQYANLIELKRIKFSKIFAFPFAIWSEPSHKTVSVGVKSTDFRRTSDPTRPP